MVHISKMNYVCGRKNWLEGVSRVVECLPDTY